MWPRLLFELLPHLTKLAPTMADKLLTARSGDNGHQAALTAMAESMRGDLEQVAQTHAGIQRALTGQGEQLSAVAVEVTRARMGVESAEARLTRLEQTITIFLRLIVAGLVLLVAILAVVAWPLLRTAH